MAPIGPTISPADAAQAVADLRLFSGRAELVVRETTELGHGLPVDDAEVLDRPGWIAATAEGMERLAAPAVAKLAAAAGGRMSGQLTRGVAGQQVGFILGFLSGKVLGQFDPLGGDPARPGRLLLVAPNIVKVERELKADPTDFRLWVCLHESTHRLQFTAVPWLREYFISLVAEFADKADPDPTQMLRRAVAALKGETTGEQGRLSWMESIQSPEQRAVFDRVMALMSLLEGHADYVMDAVGPAVVPSVTAIRASFTERRRKGAGPIDRLIRAVLGMEKKLAQYVNGGAFVREAVASVGMTRFNAVWQSPDTLPTRAEIADPAAWVRRVHG
jgi:coenzyme F420 biosynthesis associated uncharacterized protein